MRIDAKLNIVVEIETSDGSIFVHSTPISNDVFEKYFLVISKTFAALISQGLSFVSGPRVAALMLKKVATDMGVWDGVDGVQNGLMAEIRRSSNVMFPTPAGWQMIPYHTAIEREMLDAQDVNECDGIIAFFICASAMSRRSEIGPVLDQMVMWGARSTSFNCLAYRDSLPTSTPAETSPPTVNTASVPS